MSGPLLNIHAVMERSRANGPGTRFVVWFQGCSLNCPGCFNPDTHSPEPRTLVSAAGLAERIASAGAEIEGVSVSGGEPLQQAEGLLALLREVRSCTDLSVLLFSGYSLAEIRAMPLGPGILALVDVLVAGRFSQARRLGSGLRGSANQEVHLLTDRYTLADIEDVPPAEMWIDEDGNVVVSGVADVG